MEYSVDTRLKDLIEDERSREVLRKHFPDRHNDPQVQMVWYQTLRQISYYPEAGITPDKLAAIDEDLRAL
jgi:hypothetical protein